MNANAFDNTCSRIYAPYNETSRESMSKAAEEVRIDILGDDFDELTIVNAHVSLDGSWQKCGYASLNGLVTAMSSDGKCLDVEVLSKICKSCQNWEYRKDSPLYEKWKNSHICHINHIGSAGAM